MYAPTIQNTSIFENRIQKYLVEKFQDERIKRVRKTTKWAITFNDRLRLILVSCEENAKKSRKGGILSSFRPPGFEMNENLKLSKITNVSGFFIS